MRRPYTESTRRPSSARWLWLAACCVCGSSACLDNELDPEQVQEQAGGPDADGGAVAEKRLFIAQNRDFADYKSWMSFEHEVKTHEGLAGKTVIYVNKAPDTAKRAFPVGSILFKTTDAEGFDKPVIHAMTKRGSGFNADGALGWEYFELLLNKNETPVILWRGAKPPMGEMYMALLGAMNVERPMTSDGDCNSCHAEGQDGVLGDDVLKLLNGQ